MSKDYKAYNILIEAQEGRGDLNSLADKIIGIGDPEYIYLFAKIEGAPVYKLAEALIKLSKWENYLKLDNYWKERLSTDIDKIKIDCGANYIYKFAEEIPNAPIDKLADGIIDTQDASYIYKFALSIPNAPIEKLAKGVISTGDEGYIAMFFANISCDIQKIAKMVIEENNAKDIYNFALYVNGAPILQLKNAIKSTGDMKYILDFAEYVEGVSPFEFLGIANSAETDELENE